MANIPDTVRVVPVRGRRDERAFIELPYRLYAADTHWVPPLRHTERRRWSTRHNPSLQGRTVQRFIAFRGMEPVGRIAAVVDPLFHRWQEKVGFFGLFEVEPDEAVAAALLDAAEAALTGQGVRHVLGPVNLSTHDEVGFLVDGFEHAPVLLDPYNPPWYPGLVERCGYRAVREYHAYAWCPASEPAGPVRRLLDGLARRGTAAGVRIRTFQPARWHDEVALFHRLYNDCFTDLWGFVPASSAEITARASDFRAFYRPELILIAETDERAVGFALTLPDINAALRHARGNLLPLGWYRIARAVRRLTTTRLLLLGVVPEFRGRGVAALLAGALHEAGRRHGITGGELSLVQAMNEPMRRVIEAFNAPRIRTFRLYGRDVV
jgi:GNAT superfamily N-acetyltransferase